MSFFIRFVRFDNRIARRQRPRQHRQYFSWIISKFHKAEPLFLRNNCVHSFRRISGGGGGGGGGKKNKDNDFRLDALPFSVSPDNALEFFHRWAYTNQGLEYLISSTKTKISAAYVPLWSFDLNARFVVDDQSKDGSVLKTRMPSPLDCAFQGQDVANLPGISAYAGYSYRRSMVDEIHGDALLRRNIEFGMEKTIPFETWMLREMRFGVGGKGRGKYREKHAVEVDVFPDPWNATPNRALAIVRERLEGMALGDNTLAEGKVRVQMEVLSHKRIYMPLYVVEYSILGAEYRAFVSGCDDRVVSGEDHRIFRDGSGGVRHSKNGLLLANKVGQMVRSFFSQILDRARTRSGSRDTMQQFYLGSGLLSWLFSKFGRMAGLVLARLPLFFSLGSSFVAFRKIVQPWMDRRSSRSEWEQERNRATETEQGRNNEGWSDFRNFGASQAYLQQNREKIFFHMFDDNNKRRTKRVGYWYSQWENYFQKEYTNQQHWQRDQQQEQQYRHRGRSEQQHQYTHTGSKQKVHSETKNSKYQWNFDPNDPYSVLGIRKGTSKADISKAFRREMLKHHPDVKVDASKEEKEYSIERSKIITNSYRKIKTQMK